MYWKVSPYHTNDADHCVLPAETEADHSAALEYAQARLEEARDKSKPGIPASVTIELCMGDMPIDDDA